MKMQPLRASAMLNPFAPTREPDPAILGSCDDCALMREADHRIANHLSMLAALLQLKLTGLPKSPVAMPAEEVRILLQGFRSQVMAMASLHRALSKRGGPDTDIGEHLRSLCFAMSSSIIGRAAIVGDFQPGCRVRADQTLPVAQIVSEVLTNALKHAGDGGTISVRCWTGSAGEFNVEVADDGPGLPPGLDLTAQAGLGIRLIGALARQLDATVSFDSGPPGVRFRLTLLHSAEAGAC